MQADIVYQKIEKLMNEAATSRKSPMHIMNIATIREKKFPTVRQIVLRHFDSKKQLIRFHADIRSPKVKEIQQDENVEIICYNEHEKIQLRFRAKARIQYQNEISKASWDRTRHLGRKCYLTKHAPSTILQNGYSEEEKLREVYDQNINTEDGYKNFAVVECIYSYIDYLELHIKGHVRYGIEFNISDSANPQIYFLNP